MDSTCTCPNCGTRFVTGSADGWKVMSAAGVATGTCRRFTERETEKPAAVSVPTPHATDLPDYRELPIDPRGNARPHP